MCSILAVYGIFPISIRKTDKVMRRLLFTFLVVSQFAVMGFNANCMTIVRDTVTFVRLKHMAPVDSNNVSFVFDGRVVDKQFALDSLYYTGKVQSVRVVKNWNGIDGYAMVINTHGDLPQSPKTTEQSNMAVHRAWSVVGGDSFDALPMFGDGRPGAFDSWLRGHSGEVKEGSTFDSEAYGFAMVQFVIKKNGKVKDVAVIGGNLEKRKLCDKVVNLVRLSPKWTPAMKDGKRTDVVVRYPVYCFNLIR